ncbi:MAG TPA: hypothetical protein ENH33_00675 [Actinobacteria bacterium]|nr:hypothetical protein [Actinomycetota bacterium]
MTPAEIDQLAEAIDKRRPVTAPLPRRESKLRDWLPIILTTLSIAGLIAVFVFKTNVAAGVDHGKIKALVSTERETNVRQGEQIIGLDDKLDLILEAVRE